MKFQIMKLSGGQNAVRISFGLQMTARRAFSRLDLIVVIGVVVFLGLWFGFGPFGERGRIARCAGNLKVLGETMQSYANDHDDGLPAAAISLESTRIGWYADLFPYLKPGLAQAKSAYDKKQLLSAVQPCFLCPSDPGQR